MLVPSINNNWEKILKNVMVTETWEKLERFLIQEYQNKTIFPAQENLWAAFEWTNYCDVKVVILGQDPYHGEGQAHGLSFSVQPGVKIPPSLRNIYKELQDDLAIPTPTHGFLKEWAEEGVFLLNTVMTVRQGEAGSHRGQGWEYLTDSIILALNKKASPIVFILWGAEARKKRSLIDEKKHFVLTSAHPSPLSAYRGFFGSKPFSTANQLLVKSGQKAVNWNLSETPHFKKD